MLLLQQARARVSPPGATSEWVVHRFGFSAKVYILKKRKEHELLLFVYVMEVSAAVSRERDDCEQRPFGKTGGNSEDKEENESLY